jgi:ketosteroid isomerase-like protein
MDSATHQKEQEEVRLLISKINQAWLTSNFEELRGYFHDDVVTRGPSLESLGKGIDPCVKSFEDFLRAAKVDDFKESDVQVDLFGSSAIATFAWEIKYEMNGQNYHEAGHDVFVFTRDDGQWRAVWRAVLLSPAKE